MPSRSLVDKLEKLVREVVSRLDERQECSALIDQINELAGRTDYDERTFFELYGAMDEREFAEIAARGVPLRTSDLSNDDLVEIVRIISEEPGTEGFFMLEFMETNFPGADVSDLIYWPHKELTCAEVVDEILLRTSLLRKHGKKAVEARKHELAEGVIANKDSPLWAITWAEGLLTSRAGQGNP